MWASRRLTRDAPTESDALGDQFLKIATSFSRVDSDETRKELDEERTLRKKAEDALSAQSAVNQGLLAQMASVEDLLTRLHAMVDVPVAGSVRTST